MLGPPIYCGPARSDSGCEDETKFYLSRSRHMAWPGDRCPPGPTWLLERLADQGEGRLMGPDPPLAATYTRFPPRPWDVRWGRWVICRGA